MSSFLQSLGFKKTSINNKKISIKIKKNIQNHKPEIKYLLFKNRPELENILAQQKNNKNLTPEHLDYLLKNYTYEYSGSISSNTNKLSSKMDPKILNAITELRTNPQTRELFIKFIQKIKGKTPISGEEINFLNNASSYKMENVAEEINKIQNYIRDEIIRSFVAPDSSGSASEQALLGPSEIIIDYNNGNINKEKFIDLCKSLRGAIDTIIVIKDNKIIYSYYDKDIDLLKQFSNAMIKSNKSSNLYKLLPQNEQELINAEKLLAQYKIFLSYDKTKENYNKYVQYLNDINKVIKNESHLKELNKDFRDKINLIKKSLKIKYNSLQYENKANNHRNAIINREGYLFGQNGGENLAGVIVGGIFYLAYIVFVFILCGVISVLTSPYQYYKSRKNKPGNNTVVNYIPLPEESNKYSQKGGFSDFAYCLSSILNTPIY